MHRETIMTACTPVRAWPNQRSASLLARLAFGLAVLVAGCGGGGAENDAPESTDPASATVVDGNLQTATVGRPLPKALVVRVLTATGKPATARTVTFAVVGGGGAVFAGTVATNQDGYAREQWTLGTVAGTQRVEVRWLGGDGKPVVGATFDATAVSDSPARLLARSGDAQTAQQTQVLPEPIQVSVVDQFGNACAGVAVDIVADSGGSTASARIVTDSAGAASTSWTLGVPVGVQSLTATTSGLAAVTFTATATKAPPSEPVGITIVAGDQQDMAQHAQIPNALEVLVVDRLGNGVPNVSIAFGAGTGISYLATVTTTTDYAGRAQWRGYLHDAGSLTITASALTVGSVAFRVNVSASGGPYDGVYRLDQVWAPPMNYQWGPVELQLSNNSWSCVQGKNPTYLCSPTYRWSGTVDPATGSTTISFKASNLSNWVFTGTLSISAGAPAKGSGTMVERDLGGVVYSTGTWTAERL